MHLTIGNKTSSSWSMRPWVLMRAKDIAFTETLIQLRTLETAENLRKGSPSGKVPLLTDGGVTVWDSLAIMEYLAERFPDSGIWPTASPARAHARSISAEMHSGFQPLRSQCGMAITVRFAPKPLTAEVQANVTRISAIWSEARARFADTSAGPYLYGAFTAADAMYAPVVSRFHTYSIAVDPGAQTYVDAMRAHPAYREWQAGDAQEASVQEQVI